MPSYLKRIFVSLLLTLLVSVPPFEAQSQQINGTSAGTAAPTFTFPAWNSSTSVNATQMMFNTGSPPAIIVQVNQTSTITGGVITFEGSYDGTNWSTIPTAQIVNPNTFVALTNPYTLVASTVQAFLIIPQGYQQVRVRLSTAISGTGTVTNTVILLSQNPELSAVLNPVPAGTLTIGNTGSVFPVGATAVNGSATGTTAATSATLAATASVTNYVCGFSIRANATAAVTGNATLSDGTKTFNFTQWTAPLASGLGVIEMIFSPCFPASAVNTAWTLTSAAPGSGGVVSTSIWGYQK